MRILLVAPTRSDPAHRRVLAALGGRLARAGDEVVLFPSRDGLRPGELAKRLERRLNEGADVCHVQFFSRGLDWLGPVRFPPATRLVLTHQGASFELMERFDVFRGLARRAGAVTAVSRAGLEELRGLLPEAADKAALVPNGVELGRRVARASGAVRRRPFILTVGRQAAYKGTDVLLMAFAAVARVRPELDLVICGPDQSGGRLAAFTGKLGLGGRVRLLGDTPPARVERLLEECLFFTLPSRRENMPMALLEAMAAGKAVAASAVGGVVEVVNDGENGLLVRPGDAADLEAALLRLAGDAELRRRLGARASERALLFGWDAVADRYRALYGERPQESEIGGQDSPGAAVQPLVRGAQLLDGGAVVGRVPGRQPFPVQPGVEDAGGEVRA